MHSGAKLQFCGRHLLNFAQFSRQNRVQSAISRMMSHSNDSDHTNSENHTPKMQQVTGEFVKQEEIGSGKWLSLNKITYKDASGRERTWEALERTTRKGSISDGVVIMAVVKRLLKFDCVLLVKQYRPPLRACTIEFPAGLIDDGENAEQAAVRELYEETGYKAVIKHTSPGTSLDAGTESCLATLVTAEIDGDDLANQKAKPNPDEGEFIEVILVPVNELLERLNDFHGQGLVVDARVYSYAIGQAQATKSRKLTPDQK